jgi:cytochrome c biogenesis protein CcmG, thiol:disulfide interchange protein DsbE
VRLVAAVAALVLMAALTGCTADADEPAATPSTASPVETGLTPCPDQGDDAAAGDAPQVSLECLGGGTLDLGLAPGIPTVVNLWASWCGPCREELPLVEQVAGLAGDRVRVLGVASQDGRPQSSSFAEEAGLTFPSAFDGNGEVAAALGLRGLPHTLFLAADGSVAHVELGEVTSVDELRALVAEHLGVQL